MKQTSTSKSCKYSTILSFLLLLFLATFATPRALAANGEREAYVNCDTREGYIVTFYYDEYKENRPGAIFSLNTGKNEPEWVEYLNNISPLGSKARVAVFDSSFKEYRPTSCHNWFYGFSRMTDIDGLENLDTRNVTDMSGMFKGCNSLRDIDLSEFDTNGVTDMSEMFSRCSNLTSIDLSSFNTENVTDMHGMFTGCANLMLLNLSSFNTANVTNMNSMFGSCERGDEFNYSCSGCQSLRAIFVSDSWDTGKVNKSSNMFTNCTALCGGKGTQYSSGNTNATYARADGGTQSPGYLTNGYAYACKSTDGTTLTFHYDDQFLQRTGTTYVLTSQNATPNWYSDESYRTVTKVVFDPAFSEARPTTCARWFADMANITTIDGLEHLNTSDVTDMSRMFCNCNGLTNLDLSTFNTAKATDMQSMFSGCRNLKTIRVTDDWSIAKVVNSKNMFAGCSNLIGSRGTAYANAQVTDKSYAQVDGGASSPGYLTDDVPYAVLSDDGTTLTFYNDGNAHDHNAEKVFLVDWKGTSDNYVKLANNNERLTASQAANITTVAFDGSFASLKPLSCRGWFYGFESLTDFSFSNLKTSEVRTMRDMFHGCKSLRNIYIPGDPYSGYYTNTHNVTDMHGMFYGCESLVYFDNLDIITTHNVTDMSYMFYGCSNYDYLYLYCFNTTNVTDMSYMFCGCSKLNQSYSIIDPDFDYDFIGDYTDCLDLRNFSTGKVTNMAYMFSGCVNIENISLKGFNTASVTDMTGMFSGCSKLRTIITQSDWDTKKVTQSNNMFAGCTRILGGKGTTYNPTHTDKSYARLDGGKKGTPGYLSPVDNSYIVVSPDGTTFTFYCDRKKSSRTGTLYKLPNSSASWPKWIDDVSARVLHSFEYNSTITKVVFDESFKNARPVWCQNWFHNFESLTSIEGLNNLNTSVVTSMYGMFSGCCSLTSLDLSSFDTSNVEEMSDMFKDCEDLETLDISNFNTENVSSMGGMFCNCYNLTSLNLSSFNTAKVTNMSYMFSCCDNLETLTIDANKFNTGNVTDMNNMFGNCHKLTSLDVSKFNTANVTDMNNMFSNCENLAYLDVSKFNTANVTDMNNMFSKCGNLANLDVSKFNTVNVTDMNNMFSKCGSLANLDVSKFNTGKVTNMNGMFSGCGNLANLDVSKFNTANVTNMSFMFSLCESLKYLDVSKFNTANVTDMYFMFSDCESLENLDVCKFNTNNVGSMEGMFKNCSKVQFLDVRGFNTANVNNMSEMFSGCGSLTSLDVRGFNTANVGNMGQMFKGCSSLTSLDVSGFNTAKVENMSEMFRGVRQVKTLDLNGFETNNVEDMSYMFYGCNNLRAIYASEGWNTDNVGMDKSVFMFTGCSKIKGSQGTTYNSAVTNKRYARIDEGKSKHGYLSLMPYAVLSPDKKTLTFYQDGKKAEKTGEIYDIAYSADGHVSWYGKCGNVTTVVFDGSFASYVPETCDYWFSGFTKLNSFVNANNFNTSVLSSTKAMFENCTSLTTDGIGELLQSASVTTAEVTNMAQMFSGCTSLSTLDMSLLDVSEATNLSGMFSSCTSLERLDMSCMDVANVTNMSNMFSGCSNLQSLYVSDTWNVSGVTQSEGMFSNCTSLVGGQGTRYTASHTDKEYARVDGNPSAGYLTKPEAYACITKYNETTITFYYDGMQSLRGRTCHVYPLKTSGSPYWYTDNSYKIITTVVFDPSFKYALPTSCNSWFNDMNNLKEIQGVEYLNTSEVTNMGHMFSGCSSLTSLDLSHFNTENVNSMDYMFSSCESLKSLDLSSFNTANVTSMESMFRGCGELTTINVSEGWSTDNVSYDNSSGMFYNCNKIVGCMGTPYKAGEIGKEYARIDEGKNSFRPGYLSGPRQAYAFLSQDKKTLTFYYDAQKTARSAQGAVYELNTTSTYPGWYEDNSYKNITKVVFDSSFADARPTSCLAWFYKFSNLTEIADIENLNTSSVTITSIMFSGCEKLTNIDVSNFNTANVNKMNSMFKSCSSITKLNLSNFNTAKVTEMVSLFEGCSKLTTITVGDDWSTESVTKSSSMFSGCPALVGERGTTYDADNVDAAYAHIDRGEGNPGYLSYICQPYAIALKDEPTLIFYYDDQREARQKNEGETFDLNKTEEENGPGWTKKTIIGPYLTKVVFDPSFANAWIPTCHKWFSGCQKLTTIEGLEYLNTSNVTSFKEMFFKCSGFVNLELSYLNTEAAKNMNGMFALCENLTDLNISNFNTRNLETMEGMFTNCPNLTTITVGDDWSTASVTKSEEMFYGSTKLKGERGTTYDAAHTDAAYAHPDGGTDNPGYLTSINKAYALLRSSALIFYFDDKRTTREGSEGTTFDLNNAGNSPAWISDNNVAKNIHWVAFDKSFRRARPVTCEKWFCGLNLLDGIYNIENLNTSEVKDMSYMFNGYNRDLDLSTFNTDKVENMDRMFYGYSSINGLNISSFNTANVKTMKDMFNGCDFIPSINLSNFNTAKVEDMSGMFSGCKRLYAIIVGDEWSTTSVTKSDNMFTNCNVIMGEQGTEFSNTNPTDKSNAIVDGGASSPGYLTLNVSKIIYDLAGGTLPLDASGHNASNPTQFDFTEPVTLINPERAGYEFKGWIGRSAHGPTTPKTEVILSPIPANDPYAANFNHKYTAKWKALKYTITFNTNGGTNINPKDVEYESAITPPQDPQREGYTFTGWMPEIPATMPLGGITVSAQWQPIPYTITFDSNGGSTIPDLTQGYDTDITAPQNPEREGHTFTGWSPELPEKMPLNGMTVTAQWTINNYTITFNTDGATAIADIVAEYDAAITAPLDPKRKGYTFDGWDPTIPAKMPAENLTVKAQWKAIKYKITFDTDGGNTIPDLEQDYESDITAPQDPVKEGYTFTGWEPELPDKMPLDGLTVKAQWTINKYKITFDTDGGNTIPDLEQDYESDITAPQDPVKEGYTFTGWEPEIPATMPLDGLTVKAQWTINKYKITFDTDGAGAIDPIVADYQSDITAPQDPVKEGYTFTGWEPEIPATMPLDGLTVKAQWTKNQYTLKFMTDETTVYKQFALDFGAAVATPTDPEKYGFTFGGWQPEVPQTMPAADLTISAIWLAQGQYVIRFVTQGGTAIDPIVGFAGDAVTPPADPTREGYTFTGWDKPVPTTMPEENTEITAQWKANSYTVTYNAGNGSEPVTVNYDFGAAIATPANPERTGYTFDGWDAAIPATMPAANLTFNALWKINQYTLTFMTDEATVYKQITQDFGTEISAPQNPQRDGYIFGGWDKAVPTTMPAENITLTAQWAQGEYSITFMTDETTVYKVVAQDFGTAVTAPSDPVRSGYIFLGWDKAVPATMPAENITLTAQWQKAAITVAETEIEADTRNEYFCNGYAVAAFTVTAGNPTNYTIEFAEGGITTTTGSLTGSSVEIALPKGLSAGTYTGTLQLADAEGNASPRIPLTLTVSLPFYTIVPLYVDVAAVNKLAGNFTAYQWNENGVALAGETQHYLHRDFSASGVYTVTLTLADGSVRETCPLDLTRIVAARRAASVKVYPNPATRDGHVTVEVTENYDPSADKTLSIFSISGAQVKQIPNPQEISTLQLPQGTYTGVYEQNGERTTFKVLVK